MSTLALAAIALTAAALLIVYGGRAFTNLVERDGRWHPAPDGKMRRYTAGKWEYRDMTEDEALDHLGTSP